MSRPDAAALTPAGETAGLDPIKALSALDDTTRANIIGTIADHPKGAPSKKELEYYTRLGNSFLRSLTSQRAVGSDIE